MRFVNDNLKKGYRPHVLLLNNLISEPQKRFDKETEACISFVVDLINTAIKDKDYDFLEGKRYLGKNRKTCDEWLNLLPYDLNFTGKDIAKRLRRGI